MHRTERWNTLFHRSKLEKLAMVYNLDVRIEAMIIDRTHVTHATHATLIRLDRHLEEQPITRKTVKNLY